jgi:hypothetical protein
VVLYFAYSVRGSLCQVSDRLSLEIPCSSVFYLHRVLENLEGLLDEYLVDPHLPE